MDEAHLREKKDVVFGFGKAASFVLAAYFAIKVFGITMDNNWHYLSTGYGAWFLVELLGFVALPCLLYSIGVRDRSIKVIQWAAAWTVLGIVVNRFNVCLVAFNWHLPSSERYFPSWMEIGLSLSIVTVGVVVFKFIVTYMPVLYKHPDYKTPHRERRTMDFFTLQDFYTYTKGIAYILIVATLIGMAVFWLYLTDHESDDQE